jgi:hypothetical protein
MRVIALPSIRPRRRPAFQPEICPSRINAGTIASVAPVHIIENPESRGGKPDPSYPNRLPRRSASLRLKAKPTPNGISRININAAMLMQSPHLF